MTAPLILFLIEVIMFQSFTDLFIIFIGYPCGIFLLAIICELFDNNKDRWWLLPNNSQLAGLITVPAFFLPCTRLCFVVQGFFLVQIPKGSNLRFNSPLIDLWCIYPLKVLTWIIKPNLILYWCFIVVFHSTIYWLLKSSNW